MSRYEMIRNPRSNRDELLEMKGELTITQFAAMVNIPVRRMEAWCADPERTDARNVPEDMLELIARRLGEQTRRMP